MSDANELDTSTGPGGSGYVAARELLATAEAEAARARTDADRYARDREREADMLVAKARRVLVAAEERASAIVAVAQHDAAAVRAGEAIDLTERKVDDMSGAPTEIDRMLASAITHAVEDAFSLSLPR